MHISEFQKMMKEIYYVKDKRRGIEKTYIWLVEEVGELGKALIKGNIEDVSMEAADVLAWLLSLCNLLNIDLEKASMRKYPGVCPRCRSKPCKCEE